MGTTPNKKRKSLIVLDDMIADMLSNKTLNSTVTELFIRGRGRNIYLVFIRQSFFAFMEIPSKTELQQIVINHS